MECNQYNIREYLQRFWNGESSLEDERNIKDYFAFNEVPDDLKGEAAYFLNLKSFNQSAFLDDDFETEMLLMLKEKKTPKGLLVLFNSPFFRVAAAAVLIIGIVFFTWNLSDEPAIAEHTESTPISIDNITLIQDQLEDNSSYRKTKNTFMLIGDKMNTVIKHAEKLNKLNHLEEKNK